MKLEWYVLNHDFNRNKIVQYNVLEHWEETIKKMLDNYISFEKFKEDLDSEFRYRYWSRAEYEIMVSGLFDDGKEKIDIYTQIKPNLNIMARYIIDQYNNRPRGRKTINIEESDK